MVYPRVTILIPVHNDEQYISKAIDSAVAQKYQGLLQVFVVDDGSTDDSWKVVNNLFEEGVEEKVISDLELKSGKYKGVQLTAVKRPLAGGPSAARNTGIKLTINHTDIYAMLDSDDEFYPDKVRKCVYLMSSNPQLIGAVYADYDTYDTKTGKTIREFKEPFLRSFYPNSDRLPWNECWPNGWLTALFKSLWWWVSCGQKHACQVSR